MASEAYSIIQISALARRRSELAQCCGLEAKLCERVAVDGEDPDDEEVNRDGELTHAGDCRG